MAKTIVMRDCLAENILTSIEVNMLHVIPVKMLYVDEDALKDLDPAMIVKTTKDVLANIGPKIFPYVSELLDANHKVIAYKVETDHTLCFVVHTLNFDTITVNIK
jgi:hypothetical protein